MTRTTPELAPPSPNLYVTPTGGRLATMYDLACNRPHTRRIFRGIGFRTWNLPTPKSRPYPLGHRGFRKVGGKKNFHKYIQRPSWVESEYK
ncbi:hypothetical protein AVEN_143298-1 [Araneus ventricosus]|uniref:Uncharacterized protein n=1 Tax=Araneus ventricosus TaxID=182803 RepID=A0A4Y2AG98_ARAVE|nr:hypothetical protein AVEN_143298-1 [Araneus ventricosus]